MLRVRRSWAQIAGDPDAAARLFYAKLFRIDPSTKPLFVGDPVLQGRKLMQTLSFVVDHLDDEGRLMPAARDLAVRHVGYGVVAEQYASVGAALIETLARLIGPDFSTEDRAAWAETYRALSDAMIAAAYPGH
ncbi:globin domain-containing protein [Jannaschia marina]|uniref:globin domain-containing protein n=1 Tax=Jannaschia marina TaxID=2741674 RepID=UPI0015CE1443|nr:globin domain-containing protein [Jannaschia marina]